MEDANEIQEAMGRSYGTPDIDESDLEAGQYETFHCRPLVFFFTWIYFSVGVSTELDALGDELLLDEDSSYLDEASTAPTIPEGLPGDKLNNRVKSQLIVLWTLLVCFQNGFY